MNIRAIRHELLHGRDPGLRRRRWIGAIASGLATEFALIGLRQYGVVERVPDPPLPGVDSNAVITSPAAYPAGIPDAALAVAGCGALVILATAGGSERTGRPRWLDTILGLGALAGAAAGAYYVQDMIRVQKKLCVYCAAAAAGMFALVPLALPGALRALRGLDDRRA